MTQVKPSGSLYLVVVVVPDLDEFVARLQGGYTQEQLEAAFALVRPAGNWKLRIDAVVPGDTDLNLLGYAVTYFTGSEAFFQPVAGLNRDGSPRGEQGWTVVAAGYYACIGA